MEISDILFQDAKDALENWLDCGNIFPNDVIDILAKQGGGIEIHGIYYGDDEALVAHSINILCRFFNVEKDIIKRYQSKH